jgi:hypothetical protein
MNKERRYSWAEFSSSLSYRDDPRKVINIIKAKNRHPQPPANRATVSPSGKVLHSDKQKAKVFKSLFSSVSRKPRAPKGREAKAVKRRIRLVTADTVMLLTMRQTAWMRNATWTFQWKNSLQRSQLFL